MCNHVHFFALLVLVVCAGLCAAQTPQAVVSIQLYSDENCKTTPTVKSMVGLLTGVCVPNELETGGGYAQWIARPTLCHECIALRTTCLSQPRRVAELPIRSCVGDVATAA